MSTKLPEIPLGKRNNYFFGMLLSAADFSDEQSYMRSKMRLHNRMLHGWGVVSGLEVSDRKDNADAVVVHAGVALDPDGNEIVILSDVECPIPEPCDIAYLVVYWAERETDFVPFPVVQTAKEKPLWRQVLKNMQRSSTKWTPRKQSNLE